MVLTPSFSSSPMWPCSPQTPHPLTMWEKEKEEEEEEGKEEKEEGGVGLSLKSGRVEAVLLALGEGRRILSRLLQR